MCFAWSVARIVFYCDVFYCTVLFCCLYCDVFCFFCSVLCCVVLRLTCNFVLLLWCVTCTVICFDLMCYYLYCVMYDVLYWVYVLFVDCDYCLCYVHVCMCVFVYLCEWLCMSLFMCCLGCLTGPVVRVVLVCISHQESVRLNTSPQGSIIVH